MLKITKKENVMFSRYALLFLLALQSMCCDSVESAGFSRGMPHRADGITRNRNMPRRKDFKVKPATFIETIAKTPVETVSTAEPEVTLNAFDLCLCGAFATAFGDFVMHPVDTIKVSQQVRLHVLSFHLLIFVSNLPTRI